MIRKLKSVIGALVGPSEWAPLPSVVGSVEQSNTGNTVLRIGKVTVPDPDSNGIRWTQTEYVVATPEERDELIAVLESQREYQTIKAGDIVAMGAIVLAVHYANGSGGGTGRIGTVLAWDDHKREYIVWTADAYGGLSNGTYRTDQQKALNAYMARLNDHLFRHFNSTPPTLTYATVADRDKLTADPA